MLALLSQGLTGVGHGCQGSKARDGPLASQNNLNEGPRHAAARAGNRLQHLCLPPHLFERPKPTPCVTMKFANQHLQRHTWGYRDARSEPAPPSLNHASKPSAQSFFTSGSRCAAPAATQQPRLCTRRFSPLLKRVSAKRSALDRPVMATTCPRQLRFSALKHSALPLKGFWATNLNTLSPWDRVCSPLDDEDRTVCTYNNQHGSEWSATSSSEAERGEISSFPRLMLLTVTGEPRAYGRLAFRVSGCRSYYATSFLRSTKTCSQGAEPKLGPGGSCLNLGPSSFSVLITPATWGLSNRKHIRALLWLQPALPGFGVWCYTGA